MACAAFLPWTLQLTRVREIRANSAIFSMDVKEANEILYYKSMEQM